MKIKYFFPALAFGGGAAAFVLRLLQNHTGFEAATGLPVPGNRWGILLAALLAVTAVFNILLVRKLPAKKDDAPSFEDAFSSPSTASMMVLVAGIFLLAASGLLQAASSLGILPDTMVLTASGMAARAIFTSRLGLMEGVLTLLCAVSLFTTVPVCRRSGSREAGGSASQASVNGSLLLVPVVIFVVRLVLSYREDSVNPSLAAYYVSLLALVLTTLAFYRLASFAFQSGSSRRFLVYTVPAIVLCIASLADSQPLYGAFFYAGAALTFSGFLLLHIDQPHMI